MFELSKQSIPLLIILWIHFCANFYVNGESCNGAIVQNGTNETIVDANNATWKITSNNTIDENGQPAGYSADVVLLVYWDRIVYQSNQQRGWWGWINNTWVDVTNSTLTLNLTSASGCPDVILSDTSSLPMATTIGTNAPPLSYFVPHSCNDSNYIGDFCNISMKPCDALQPCQNLGSCTNDPSLVRGYSCMCVPGFNGNNCELDIQVCQSNICLYNGTCKEFNSTQFYCNCIQGRTGIHCELLINYCNNVTCLNNGICRSLLLNFTCECLSSNSGRYCEHVATSLLIRQYVSKGFAYIAIIVIITAASFIVILDILKYGFGIDLAQKECDRIRHERASHNKNNRKTRKPQKAIRLRRMNKIAPLP